MYTVPSFDWERREVDLKKYFTGKTVVVDEQFAKCLEQSHETTSTPKLSVAVVYIPSLRDADDIYRAIFRRMPTGEYPSAVYGHAVLAFLGSEQGKELLAIPKEMDEINLIIGYMCEDGKVFVLYVEHEFEDGVREIHLHARPVGTWFNDIPRALIILNEEM
jgi:hypothetical protein